MSFWICAGFSIVQLMNVLRMQYVLHICISIHIHHLCDRKESFSNNRLLVYEWHVNDCKSNCLSLQTA